MVLGSKDMVHSCMCEGSITAVGHTVCMEVGAPTSTLSNTATLTPEEGSSNRCKQKTLQVMLVLC